MNPTLCCEACEPMRFMPPSERKCQVCGGPHELGVTVLAPARPTHEKPQRPLRDWEQAIENRLHDEYNRLYGGAR